jgi:GTP pyrophosphokinase
MAEDVRVMIIKFADRLHNLETLDALPADKQLRIARESMEIYAPLAHRLGMGEIKGQIEDLAFPYVWPKEYAWVQDIVGPRYATLDRIVDEMMLGIREGSVRDHVTLIDLHGRRKHLYSLYEKLIRPEYNRDIQRITDLVALRVIVQNITDCYAVIGLVHQLWKPVPNRFKDYIAQPKPNGYRSLHTTVFGPHGQIVEIQVRDQHMHEEAEFGVAAHWHYNEAGKPDQGVKVKPKMAWAQQLAEWKQELADDEQYLEALKIDALQKRIFCFTPTGDVIDLPEHATPIDFAYHVHSDLGTKCVGAKVNDKLVALDTELRSGDVIEILTDKNRKLPNRDWLQIAKTQTARGHIRKALRESGTEFVD